MDKKDRITSYNVCYTKLLRLNPEVLLVAPPPVATLSYFKGMFGRITSYNVCYTKLLRQ